VWREALLAGGSCALCGLQIAAAASSAAGAAAALGCALLLAPLCLLSCQRHGLRQLWRCGAAALLAPVSLAALQMHDALPHAGPAPWASAARVDERIILLGAAVPLVALSVVEWCATQARPPPRPLPEPSSRSASRNV
jgi:hypothetical protein